MIKGYKTRLKNFEKKFSRNFDLVDEDELVHRYYGGLSYLEFKLSIELSNQVEIVTGYDIKCFHPKNYATYIVGGVGQVIQCDFWNGTYQNKITPRIKSHIIKALQ